MGADACGLALTGARALVTASTKGIGFGIARVLASCGARVVINGRNPGTVSESVEKLSSLGEVSGIACDLTQEGCASRLVREAASRLGGLDALVYVPPPPPGGRFQEVSLEDWRLSYRLLVEAPIEAVTTAVDYLRESKNPSITFVTSIAAWEAFPEIATSTVLRPSLHALTVLLARELGPLGVRVNAVVPGYILTDRLIALAEKRAGLRGTTSDQELGEMARVIPLGRIGEKEEVGWIAAFLASPRASYVTGAIVAATGGLHRLTR